MVAVVVLTVGGTGSVARTANESAARITLTDGELPGRGAGCQWSPGVASDASN